MPEERALSDSHEESTPYPRADQQALSGRNKLQVAGSAFFARGIANPLGKRPQPLEALPGPVAK